MDLRTRPPSIEVRDLSKVYRIYGNPYGRLLERLPWVDRSYHRAVPALLDIGFEVGAGQCVGLVGGNGAGKSTLLKILTGTTFPSAGSYTVRGRVASLLELGAGFQQDFTGRENVYINASLMGFSRRETKRKFEEILEFSELHEFIDAPIRTYSSGMVCRLGFAVAVATDPDVLIIDEILSVGDMHFQKKCVDRIWSYKNAGKTLFFCSHSLYDVRQICDRAIWLKKGRMQMFDDAVTVTNDYAAYENQLMAAEDGGEYDREGAGELDPTVAVEGQPHIVSARLIDPASGEPRHVFAPGERAAVEVMIRNGRDPVPLQVGITFERTGGGGQLFGTTTGIDGVGPVEFDAGRVVLELPSVELLSGTFVVPVYLLDGNGVHRYHERPCTANLVVQNRSAELGMVRHPRRWHIEALPPASLAAVAEDDAR